MKKVLGLLLLSAFLLTGCTQNQRAKSFGGTAKVYLPEGKKLVEATWKGEELWYLMRDRREDEKPETYTFKEESSYGVMEGTVIFYEK